MKDNQRQAINFLVELRGYKSLDQFFKDNDVPKESQRYFTMLAQAGIAKNGRNYIVNYPFFSAIGFKQQEISEYLDFLKKPKSWKNWESFKITELDYDDDKVGEWLESTPEDCTYQNRAGTKVLRNYGLMLYKIYKELGEVPTLARLKRVKAVQSDSSEFSEEEWNAFDLIHDKIARMNSAVKSREEKELTNFSEPLDFL